jgi:hypothetical protein
MAPNAAPASVTRILLGTHMKNWLWDPDPRFDNITYFVSYNRLDMRSTPFPRARRDCCFDSGGFTHLKKYGCWTVGPADYVDKVRRWREELGQDRVLWIAPQDWMCEPWVIFGKNQHLSPKHRDFFHGTRLARGVGPGGPELDLDTAVSVHQRFTVDNYLELRSLAPDLPIIPVLQGWELRHYQRCADMYAAAGVDLSAAAVVGLGSVCRRQATTEIRDIVNHFAAQGLRLHGFGVKALGLASYAGGLVSADSLAWSDDARRSKKGALPGHTHKNCANCPDWALDWYQRRVAELANMPKGGT